MRTRPVAALAVVAVLVMAAFLWIQASAPVDGVIELQPEARFQIITGWEATAQAAHTHLTTYPRFRDELLTRVVNELGINRLRLEVRGGMENRRNDFADYREGRITGHELLARYCRVENDNDDPFVTDSSGFDFSELDDTITKIAIPMRDLLAARGEPLSLNVAFVDFCTTPSNQLDRPRMGIWHKAHPEEYAEFVVAVYQHLQRAHDLIPATWQLILEPDNADWSGDDIARVARATAARLRGQGATPAFVAPSTTDMGNAVEYARGLASDGEAAGALAELSYHRYRGTSPRNLQAIAAFATKHSVATAMLEHIGSGVDSLHDDLTVGNASAWQQYALAFTGGDTGAHYYVIDDSDPDAPKVGLSATARWLRHYFLKVRAGAQRVGAVSTHRSLLPVAFINRDGSHVVVTRARRAGQITIRGLPAGEYSIWWSTRDDEQQSSHAVAAGGELSARMPAEGVMTVSAQ